MTYQFSRVRKLRCTFSQQKQSDSRYPNCVPASIRILVDVTLRYHLHQSGVAARNRDFDYACPITILIMVVTVLSKLGRPPFLLSAGKFGATQLRDSLV
jgi:hypothetical protein